MDLESDGHGATRNPENCGHGGTIHLGRGFEGDKQCKLCGIHLDQYGREIPETGPYYESETDRRTAYAE